MPPQVEVTQTGSKKLCFVVINAAPTQGSEVGETRAALEAAGVHVAAVVIHQRKAFSARSHEGRTAMEHEPGGKASAEINALLIWVCETVGLAIRQHRKVQRKPNNDASRKQATKLPRDPGGKVAGQPTLKEAARSTNKVARV